MSLALAMAAAAGEQLWFAVAAAGVQLSVLLQETFGRGSCDKPSILCNLIPYNENGLGLPGGPLFQSAEMDDVRAFQRHLWSKGMLCTVRATRGDDDRAACGQLATASRRRKKEVSA